MLHRRGHTDLQPVQRGGVVHLQPGVSDPPAARLRARTLYRAMNSSTDGTSAPTSLRIVLYCESSFVHAGEYLPRTPSAHAPTAS